jgi:hypothetical protein
MAIEPHTAQAWIFQPAPNAMQSGRRKRPWHLEFDPAAAQQLSPLMGWPGGGDMDQQLVMRFPTRETAVAFCERHGIRYTVEPPPREAITPKSYADNFRKSFR